MKRVFWIALGATAGVMIVRKLTKAADSFTPEGAADQMTKAAGTLSEAIREFAEDVRAGMAERDQELREALGIVGNDADNGSSGGREPDMAAVDDLLSTHQRRGTF
ncbi:hypothetical protein EF847_12860 [Actinobacteria bacterium YIM 96077]|uniref:Secreted protein n=1 Tax=Phytoactinopolyspora halophila TaxID=1981511 RepID=A0A329QED6_9ACTN|nr:DUF6167 family protein [Phytoactinopolyspora halophila]AYY13450.1 hypothetical protein EF847_12860 [Actinobacteria bacterium YIM 96077]RAW10843.1 hypothetical protein DPM12_18240 [Phytoactinopolyspora halophila]